MRWMREDREPTSPVDQANRVRNREAFLRYVCWTTVAEVAIEGVAKIDCPALGDHGASDMRPTNCTARRLLEDSLESDSHTEIVEALHDARGARATHVSEPEEFRLHCACVR